MGSSTSGPDTSHSSGFTETTKGPVRTLYDEKCWACALPYPEISQVPPIIDHAVCSIMFYYVLLINEALKHCPFPVNLGSKYGFSGIWSTFLSIQSQTLSLYVPIVIFNSVQTLSLYVPIVILNSRIIWILVSSPHLHPPSTTQTPGSSLHIIAFVNILRESRSNPVEPVLRTK